MADFSFLDDSGLKRKTPTKDAGAAQDKGKAPAKVHIPTLAEVKAAERQRQASAGLDMFRPSRAGAATGTAPVPYNAAPAAALAMRATPPSGQRPAQQPGPATSGAVPGPKATQRTSTGVFDLSSPRSSGAAGPSEQHGSRSLSAHTAAYSSKAWGGSMVPAGVTFDPVASSNAVVYNASRQHKNPVLKHIINLSVLPADIVPDFQLGQQACVLFLSLKYHRLHPEYIVSRMKEILRSFRLRVVLCHVDVEDPKEPLGQVNKLAALNGFTLLCGFSQKECARYLETLRAYEQRPADAIQGRTEADYLSRLTAVLTTVRGVNKTDVLTLGNKFGTAADMFAATPEELAECPGLGPTKIRRLQEAFREPFRRSLAPGAGTGSAAAQTASPPAAAATGQDSDSGSDESL